MNLTICTTLQLSPSNVDYIYFCKFIIHWYFLNESTNPQNLLYAKIKMGNILTLLLLLKYYHPLKIINELINVIINDQQIAFNNFKLELFIYIRSFL